MNGAGSPRTEVPGHRVLGTEAGFAQANPVIKEATAVKPWSFTGEKFGKSEDKMDYFAHPKAFIETRHIGNGTRIWAFTHIMKGARIGRDCNVGEHCYIESDVVIGDNVTVKNAISIWDRIRIEDGAFLGPNMVFTNVLFPRSGMRDKDKFLPIRVKRGATIGANATIVCGVSIGEYAFVGAGTVVTKDVPPFSIVYGNPARPKGYICRCAKKLRFEKNKALCACGARYALRNNSVREI